MWQDMLGGDKVWYTKMEQQTLILFFSLQNNLGSAVAAPSQGHEMPLDLMSVNGPWEDLNPSQLS